MAPDSSFEKSFVIERERPKMKNPVLVAGLPGIGFVSKLAVDHLTKSLKAKRFASLYSPHFPNQVLAMKNGKLRPFTMRLYHKRLKKHDLILVRGDLQPLTVEGQYEVSAKLLQYFAELGGKDVIAMAGYAVNRVVEKPKIYGFATEKTFFESWRKAGAAPNEFIVPIVGMAGLLPSLSKIYGERGVALLVETPGNVVDAVGAKALVQLLSKWMGESLDVKALEARAKKAQALYARIEQQAGQAAAAAGKPAMGEKGPEVHAYIR